MMFNLSKPRGKQKLYCGLFLAKDIENQFFIAHFIKSNRFDNLVSKTVRNLKICAYYANQDRDVIRFSNPGGQGGHRVN